MRNVTLGALAVTALVAAGLDAAPAARKPRLDLRAAPRMTFSPANILVTAELTGGDEADEFYCPEIEWNWDDGTKSVRESDCPPREEGGSFERRYTATHAYRQAGVYNVKITMRHARRVISAASATVTVRPGVGDMSDMNGDGSGFER